MEEEDQESQVVTRDYEDVENCKRDETARKDKIRQTASLADTNLEPGSAT